MATIRLNRQPRPFRAQLNVAHSHRDVREFRTLQSREMRNDTVWRTPSGVPFAWIGHNPPRGYDAGATEDLVS